MNVFKGNAYELHTTFLWPVIILSDLYVDSSFIHCEKPTSFFYRARNMNGGSMCATIRVLRTKMFEMIMFYATEIKHPRF